MFLIHSSDPDYLFKILKDGYMKSSKETKNIRMFGQPQGSIYIYLRLGKRNDNLCTMYFDNKLLLANKFYLTIVWHAEPITERIDGSKLDEIELNELLKKFNIKVNNYYNRIQQKIPIPIIMSNEILVEKKISLQKYLKKIKIYKPYNKKFIDFCEINYPNILIIKE